MFFAPAKVVTGPLIETNGGKVGKPTIAAPGSRIGNTAPFANLAHQGSPPHSRLPADAQ
jgi:hypothetical protein